MTHREGILSECKGCNNIFTSILKHLSKKPECKSKYTEKEIQELSEERKNRANAKYYSNVTSKSDGDMRKPFDAENSMYVKFFKEIRHGPIYPCVSCHRKLPLRTVHVFQDTSFHWIKQNGDEKENIDVEFDKSVHLNGIYYICTACKKHLQQQKMPPLCYKNGLELAKIPDEFKNLGELGNQLIAKKLIFLKLRPLPKTGMKSMFDRVINVPIPDDDVIKTVTSLPRNPDNDGLVNVKLKRKLEYNRTVNEEVVDRQTLLKCLEHLKKNHASYSDITLSEPPVKKIKLSVIDEESNQQIEPGQPNRKRKYSKNEDEEEDSETEDENETENPFLVSTCLQPEDPESRIIVNNSCEPLRKKRKLNSNITYEVAPGENKVIYRLNN